MFNIGFSELVLILLVAFVIVGPKDLPKVARALARGIRSVKKMISEFKEETGLDETIDEFKKTTRDLEKTIRENDPSDDIRQAGREVKAELDDVVQAAKDSLDDAPNNTTNGRNA